MGEFDDLIPGNSGGGEFDDLIPQTKTFTPESNQTININDLPHILAKGSSGILGGIPETVMRNPISGVTGAAGKAGMGIARFFNRNVPNVAQEPNYFPEANSEQGKMAGIAAELAGGLVSPLGVGNNSLKAGKVGMAKLFPSRIVQGGDAKLVGKLDKIREAFGGARQNLSKQFGLDLDAITAANPNTGVDFSTELQSLLNSSGNHPRLASLIERNPLLRQVIDNPSLARDMPLRQHQELMNQIQSSLPSGIAKKFGLLSPEEATLIDHVNNMKDAALNSFPDLHMARDEYKQGIEAFKKIRGNIGEKGLENFIHGDFKNAEVRNLVQKLIGDNPEAVKLIKSVQGQRRLADLLGRAKDAVGTATIGAAGYGLAKKLTGG